MTDISNPMINFPLLTIDTDIESTYSGYESEYSTTSTVYPNTLSPLSLSPLRENGESDIEWTDICNQCLRPFNGPHYCKNCTLKQLELQFKEWTSGNDPIDRIIKDAQYSANNCDQLIEWIPFEQFQNIKFLGEGGFGIVYSAIWKDGPILKWDKGESQWVRRPKYAVALKALKKTDDGDDDELLNELKAYQSANQSNYNAHVIWIMGVTQNSDGVYMMVMPLAKYGDLRTYIRKNFATFTWPQRLKMVYYIANGLSNIHDAELIHCDFHTGNILQFSTHYSYIGDLGLSKPINPPSPSNKKGFGVIPYMAPEILRGGQYTKASDVYSFGMIMWEIATGSPPFSLRAHDSYLMLEILDGNRPTTNRKIPRCYKQLMKRCWDSLPSNRPTINEIKNQLFSWYTELETNDSMNSVIRADFEVTEQDRVKEVKSLGAEKYGTQDIMSMMHPQAVYTSRELFLPDFLSQGSGEVSIDQNFTESRDNSILQNPSQYSGDLVDSREHETVISLNANRHLLMHQRIETKTIPNFPEIKSVDVTRRNSIDGSESRSIPIPSQVNSENFNRSSSLANIIEYESSEKESRSSKKVGKRASTDSFSTISSNWTNSNGSSRNPSLEAKSHGKNYMGNNPLVPLNPTKEASIFSSPDNFPLSNFGNGTGITKEFTNIQLESEHHKKNVASYNKTRNHSGNSCFPEDSDNECLSETQHNLFESNEKMTPKLPTNHILEQHTGLTPEIKSLLYGQRVESENDGNMGTLDFELIPSSGSRDIMDDGNGSFYGNSDFSVSSPKRLHHYDTDFQHISAYSNEDAQSKKTDNPLFDLRKKRKV
ncbi:hypothetical protein G9A89_008116 [Geosiphon pyriformis]|nr:hypothetical protein G9A89_008116 [Geosiphon pyriformis]